MADPRKLPLGIEVRLLGKGQAAGRVAFKLRATREPGRRERFFSTREIGKALEEARLEGQSWGKIKLDAPSGSGPLTWTHFFPYPEIHGAALEKRGMAAKVQDLVAEVLEGMFPGKRVRFMGPLRVLGGKGRGHESANAAIPAGNGH